MMVRLHPQSLVFYFLMALVLVGCSYSGPGPRLPVVTQVPIAVDSASVLPVTFGGVVIAIEPGTLLGYHYEGAGMSKDYDYRWGPNFTEKSDEMNLDVLDILENAGYRTVPWPTGGVTETPAGETVLKLKATVTLLEFNSFSSAGGYYQAYCVVSWDLVNPGDGTSLFQARTEGYKKENEHNAGVLRKAFDQALTNLLADRGFADAVAGQVATRTGPSATYTMEQFVKSLSIDGSSFNHDETRLLVRSNESGVFNVYELDLATGGRTPVTEGDETTMAVAYMPHDDRILYTRDKDGSENNHLFLRDTDGTVRDLTIGDETREVFAGFHPDLDSFFTRNNQRDARFFDLFQWDAATLDKSLVFQNEEGFEPFDVTADGRWIVLTRSNTTNDSDILVADLKAGGAPYLVSEHSGEASFRPQALSADSRYLYYTTNDGGEFLVLKRYDLAAGTHEEVFATDWDVAFAYFSLTGKYRVIGTNEDGYTKVRITRDGQDVELSGLPDGTVSRLAFSHSEKLMKVTVSSDTMPGNMFLINLDTGDVRQLTDTLNPEIDAGDLVASTIVRFQARDGLTIPGPLYKPIGADAQNKVPVMLWIHGGPGGQTRPGYSGEKQFLINHGYALFAVNNRGSSGYGKTFLAADDRRHGREPLWDCVDAKEYLKTLDWVDPDRIGIMGGSYGGYMTLAALAFEPEEFTCGVDLFGVANWMLTLESIPPYWESFRKALYQEIGHPVEDADFLRETSPVFHGDKITRPLLILQGANDPRVLQRESDDMVAAIRAGGGTVEYLVFEDEGHGFRKSANRVKGFNAILGFLDTYLKGDLQKKGTP